MKVVVMAGGAGSRLRPLTIHRPKPMVPVVNKPALAHILDLLKRHGATEIIITVQYLADLIQTFFGDGSSLGLNIRYSVEESPLGTAGSVKNAQQWLDDTFIVISGDALTDLNLSNIIAYHKKKRGLVTIALYRIPDPVEYGVITLNSDGVITRFQEKPSRGSVVSDYINTGIYVLEPEVLDFFEPNAPFDFAKDLFPLLQQQGYPLYGCIAEGYWCDIGNISEYMRATADALEGKINGIDLGHYLGDGIWVGKDVEIDPTAHLEGPIYLGDSVQIRANVHIKGPAVIRDYTVVDDQAVIEQSVFWRNCYVGEWVETRGAIILRQCSLKTRSIVDEGAVVADRTIVGQGAIIQSNVKIWPNKEIEPQATVNSSIIWGAQGRRDLFGRHGITGVVNVDLTPEFSAKLGAAFGATLRKGAVVTINRDTNRSPRMIKRAIISGLPSAGVDVVDLESQPLPVARYFTNNSNAAGGIHVQLSPADERVVDILIIDEHGQNLTENRQRAMERIFFREDFRRVYMEDIGSIAYAQHVVEMYTNEFLKNLNTRAIRAHQFNLVVDYANTTVGAVLPPVFNELDCNVVALNASVTEAGHIRTEPEQEIALNQLKIITAALGSQLGVCFKANGEKIHIADDCGRLLPGIVVCAVIIDLALRDAPGSTVAVPLDMPNLLDDIVARHGGTVIRTEPDRAALLKVATQHQVLFAGNERGNYMFPDFQHAFDGLMTLAKILEYLATQQTSFSEIVNNLPAYHQAHRIVPCPWSEKARAMRILTETYPQATSHRYNSLKLFLGAGRWVLITPDPAHPVFRIVAEGHSDADAEDLVAEYAETVQTMVGTTD